MQTRLKIFGLATLCLAACAPPAGQSSFDTTEFGDDFEDEDKLAIELDDSPSGSNDFTFCTTPEGTGVNLHNATWMAYLAANEYAHLGYLAPNLLELGFGNGGDFFWRGCGVALRQVWRWQNANEQALAEAFAEGPEAVKKLIDWQIDPANPDAWDVCAREWVEATNYDGTEYPGPGFQTWLIQEPSGANDIAFFSGGAITGLEGNSFKQGSTQAFYARHSELPMAVFSFRGTEPDALEDIKADLKAWDVDLSAQEGGHWNEQWGQVHAGFYEAFASLLPQFDQQLEALEGSDDAIWVTGHSLGGALATLMTAYILEQKERGRDLELAGAYTFGSPRVGNYAFQSRFTTLAEKYGVRVGRVRNHKDIVTAVPTGIVNSWYHVGDRIYMTPEALSFPSKNPKYWWRFSASDHSMAGRDEQGVGTSYYHRLLDFTRTGDYDFANRCAVPTE